MQQLQIFNTLSKEQELTAIVKHNVNGSAVNHGEIRYKISSTNGNSQKYGNCERCGKICSTVYSQSSEQYFEFTDNEGKFYSGWAVRAGLYGCEKCLLEARK